MLSGLRYVFLPDRPDQKGPVGVGFHGGADVVEVGFDDQGNEPGRGLVVAQNMVFGVLVMAVAQENGGGNDQQEKAQRKPQNIPAGGEPGQSEGLLNFFWDHKLLNGSFKSKRKPSAGMGGLFPWLPNASVGCIMGRSSGKVKREIGFGGSCGRA